MKRERLEELVRSTNEAVGRVNGEFVSEYSASAIRAALLSVELETIGRCSTVCAAERTGDVYEERGMGFDDGCDSCAAKIRSRREAA